MRERILESVEETLAGLDSPAQSFPFYVERGRWVKTSRSGWEQSPGNWTAGFWVGLLWLAWSWSGLERFRRAAEVACEAVAERAEWKSHDLGFLFLPSCALGFDLTGDLRFRRWALSAARTQVSLGQEPSGILALRPPRQGSFCGAVDTMANLELLLWANRQTGEPHFLAWAARHAAAVLRWLVRPDGGTLHVARWKFGERSPLWRGSWQGASDGSCWSRGHAWTMAGLGLLERASPLAGGVSRTDFLARREPSRVGTVPGRPSPEANDWRPALRQLSAYWERHSGWDQLPPWDFNDLRPVAPRDSSAAAIASFALLLSSDDRLCQAGRLLLATLSRSVRESPSGPGILPHGCFHYPQGLGVNTCTIWGDYYLARALNLTVPAPD